MYRTLTSGIGIALVATLCFAGAAQAGTTKLVKDIHPVSSDPSNLTAYGGKLFFVASEPGSGRELWKSDGTRAGTKMVKDIWGGSGIGRFL